MIARWWFFCKQRFVPAASLFTAMLIGGSADLVAQGSASPLRVDLKTLVAVLLVFAVLYLLRVQDDIKDLETDRSVHPERALASGQISAGELAASALVVVVTCAGLLGWAAPAALPYFGVTLLYLGLMRYEMFAGEWLDRHPVVYLVSHQLVVPVFVTTAMMVRGDIAPNHAAALSLAALGCAWAFELGRKIRTPENEQAGEESWTKIFGTRRAAYVTLLGVAAALAGVGALVGTGSVPAWTIGAAAAGCLLAAWPFLAFARAPAPSTEKPLMGAGALVSLVVYGGLIAARLVSAPKIEWFGGLS